ncbi:efflux RND transporter periplasmic adaptor subunit [Halovulum sp. GXIMD14793]
MRLMPILTASLVATALFGAIMKRDELRAFAMTYLEVPEEELADEAPTTEENNPKPEGVSVVVRRSVAETVESGLKLSGRTEAARNIEVRAETSGLVVSEAIRKGASVAEGDVLCHLDTGTREASLAEAKARLVDAENKNRTAQKLAERGVSSETAAISSAAALEAAQAMVSQAEKEIDRLTIQAPFAGVLESDTAELGTLLQPGAPCATLITLNPIHIVGFVPETDVEKLSLGSEAGARLSTGREILGRVTFISRAADPLTRTFRVEVEVPNPDTSIRDGLSADILIALSGGIGHFLPQSALTLNNEGQLGVRINENGVTGFTPVSVIRDMASGIWVAGLPETVEVIVVGQDFVTEGSPIRVTYEDEVNQ